MVGDRVGRLAEGREVVGRPPAPAAVEHVQRPAGRGGIIDRDVDRAFDVVVAVDEDHEGPASGIAMQRRRRRPVAALTTCA
jgi:hypothetical protein